MIRKILFKILRYSGLPYLLRETIQRNRVSILMYHDPSPQSLEQCFQYLIRHYNIIDLNDYLDCVENRKLLPPKSVIITFDDGHKRNFELLPIFKKYNIKATVFLCSAIVDTHRHYWFLEKMPKRRKRLYKSIPNQERLNAMQKHGFNQDREYEERQSLNLSEIHAMLPWVNFQSHTMYHPCLDNCTDAVSQFEITQSKVDLENKLNAPINAIAFPNGNFTQREIRLARKAGYQCALTVTPGYNKVSSDLFSLRRFSINDTENLDEFIIRTSGLWGLFKSLKLQSTKSNKEFNAHENPDRIRATTVA